MDKLLAIVLSNKTIENLKSEASFLAGACMLTDFDTF